MALRPLGSCPLSLDTTTTDIASAAASGSPFFDRRSFIATLAAVGVMTGGATLPADRNVARMREIIEAFELYEARKKAAEDACGYTAAAEASERETLVNREPLDSISRTPAPPGQF